MYTIKLGLSKSLYYKPSKYTNKKKLTKSQSPKLFVIRQKEFSAPTGQTNILAVVKIHSYIYLTFKKHDLIDTLSN